MCALTIMNPNPKMYSEPEKEDVNKNKMDAVFLVLSEPYFEPLIASKVSADFNR